MKFLQNIPAPLKFSPFFALVFFIACANPPEYPVVPEIEFVRMSKDTIARPLGGIVFTNDSILVTISFTDGDGDIGDRDTTLSLYYIDSRDGAVNDLKIPFVNEAGASSGIKGEITFNVPPQCCIFPPETFLDGCNDETDELLYDPLTYDIYILDRKGNQSNIATTNTIYVRCFD